MFCAPRFAFLTHSEIAFADAVVHFSDGTTSLQQLFGSLSSALPAGVSCKMKFNPVSPVGLPERKQQQNKRATTVISTERIFINIQTVMTKKTGSSGSDLYLAIMGAAEWRRSNPIQFHSSSRVLAMCIFQKHQRQLATRFDCYGDDIRIRIERTS